MTNEILHRAQAWTQSPFDASTQAQARDLLAQGGSALADAFYQDLDFGTGGLRGIMGVGTNRVNRYTLGQATQGLANYLKTQFNNQGIHVAIAHDSRNNSRQFAELVADVLSANGIHAHLFHELRPTPLLSFAVRHLKCQAGIVLTASHNPPEYNGYKVYWEDGGQLVPPQDQAVIEAVRAVAINSIHFESNKEYIHSIGKELDEAYFSALASQQLGSAGKENLKVVFTPLHGTSVTVLPEALRRMGFAHVDVVQAQAIPDGNFPTVTSPNPEEASALQMAVEQAEGTGADLVIGCDPDADRVGIAVKNRDGKMVLLNGNQTASLLVHYLLKKWKEAGKLNGKQFIAETIVTTDLLQIMAAAYGVECPVCLTGFKWIAQLIREREGQKQFIGGGEESYGYMIGDFVRDKDAIASAAMIAEAAAESKDQGSNFLQDLEDIHRTYGCFVEDLISITKKGMNGAQEIEQMMETLRSNPPEQLGGEPVVLLLDYKKREKLDILTKTKTEIQLPKSNVIQLVTSGGSKITARPSGTEPKIKFYFSATKKMDPNESYQTVVDQLKERIQRYQKELNLK